MQTGIIGLPQVGKTSLFRILTRAKVDTRSAPAQMHLGIARVPDARVAKLAEALLQLVALPTPPVRLPLGPDALKRIAAKNEFVNQEMERWKTLSMTTNFS